MGHAETAADTPIHQRGTSLRPNDCNCADVLFMLSRVHFFPA